MNFEVQDFVGSDIVKEIFENPMDISNINMAIQPQSEAGLLIYLTKDFGLTQYAIHFKNKDGKDIATTTKNGKEYLVFDFYYLSMMNTYFSIEGNQYSLPMGDGMSMFKQSFEIEVTKDATFLLDLTMM